MQLKIKKYLQDIITSIESIGNFTKGITKYEDFISNRLVYRAVERELEIIAEAITRIPPERVSHSFALFGSILLPFFYVFFYVPSVPMW